MNHLEERTTYIWIDFLCVNVSLAEELKSFIFAHRRTRSSMVSKATVVLVNTNLIRNVGKIDCLRLSVWCFGVAFLNMIEHQFVKKHCNM